MEYVYLDVLACDLRPAVLIFSLFPKTRWKLPYRHRPLLSNSFWQMRRSEGQKLQHMVLHHPKVLCKLSVLSDILHTPLNRKRVLSNNLLRRDSRLQLLIIYCADWKFVKLEDAAIRQQVRELRVPHCRNAGDSLQEANNAYSDYMQS